MESLLSGTRNAGAPAVIQSWKLRDYNWDALAAVLVGMTAGGDLVPLTVGSGGGLVAAPNPATGLVAGTTALTTAAAQLPNNPGRSALLFNDPVAGIVIFIGSATSQPIKLQPGDSFGSDVANLNLYWAKSASGTPSLAWVMYS
jgi:hypothetical protein